jgi:hypothetical protein
MNAHRFLFRFAPILISLVLLGGCHEGDAPTEPPAVRTTPTPPPAGELSGTWTARLGESTETFTATVFQAGQTVTADWTRPTHGAMRFVGELDRDQLRGHLTVERDSADCPMNNAPLAGTANATRIIVSGYVLCKNFDASHLSVELTR